MPGPSPIRILAAIAALAASLVAQVPDSRANRPVAFDVHVLKLTTSPSELVPTAVVVASKRIGADPHRGQGVFQVRVGETRFGVEVQEDGNGRIVIERQAGHSSYSSSSSQPGRTIDVAEPWRWGRRPRRGTLVRGALLCEPVMDPATPFAALDARGFMQHLVDLLLAEEAPPAELRQGIHIGNWLTPQWLAACVLGSVPLREYLEPGEVDRILAKGGKIPAGFSDRFWPLLRPLIALGHRPMLEALANRREEHDEADPERQRGAAGAALPPSVPRTIEDSVLIAYATATDPAIRGLAGWIATGTRSTDIYDMLLDDVAAGRAELPGDAARRAALTSHIVHARAWRKTTAPLLTLAGSALVIAAAMLLLRAVMRRFL